MPADAQTHVEMLLTARDMATEAITRSQQSVEAATTAMASSLEQANTQAERTTFAIGGKMSAALGSAAVQARDLGSALLNVTGGAIKKGFKLSILGPFEALFKLLSPIINAVVDVLSPAFETFGALIKNELAPLSFLFETMAQQLAPLVQKLIQPLVALLEHAAVHFGTLLADILKVDGPANALAGMFFRLAPVVSSLVKAFVDLGAQLIPQVVGIFNELVPLAVEFAELMGKQLVDVVKILGGVWAEVGPELVRTMLDLLKALLPILPPLAKLSTVLLKEVFAPLTIKTIKLVAELLTNSIIPAIQDTVAIAVPFIEDITSRLDQFFGNLGKYASDFNTLFIQPIAGHIAWLGEQWSKIFAALGLSEFGTQVSGVFQAIGGMVEGAIEGSIGTLKSWLNQGVVTPLNAILNFDIPVIGKLSQFAGLGADYEIPLLARGAASTIPGKPAVIGEAGPEMAIPLTPENVRTVLEPILPSVELPGMEDAVMWLRRIHQALTGTLRVEGMAGSPVAAERTRERDDLGSAVGFSGLAGGM